MKRLSWRLAAAAVLMMLVCAPASASKKGKVLRMTFNTAIDERGGSSLTVNVIPPSINTGGSVPLINQIRAIEEAAKDDRIEMIFMTPDNLSAGMAQTEELRAALADFRAAGKQIVAYCHSVNAKSLYLATVADKVILDPASENMFFGMSSQSYFLKDIIDTLGINIQLIRHGKYKSAGEMFTKNDFSPENREQNQVMLNALWATYRDGICESRGIKPEDMDKWIDNLEFTTARTFKEKGLVDELWFKDQLDSCLCSMYDVTGISQIPYVNIGKYASKLKKGPGKNQIAIIYANGEIAMEGAGVNGPKLASAIAKVREDNSIKAVVFRVNSPGGSVQASELIRREITLLAEKKPVIASYGDYAASGGYWISAGADKIYADKSTLTGSIGCFSMVPSFGDAIREKVHVNIATLGTHAHSDAGAGMRPLDEAELAFFQEQIEDIYDQFTTIVSEGRDIEKNKVDEIGQGRVWAGTDALKIGLCDAQGGLLDAIWFAADSVGLDEYRIVEYPEVTSMSLMSMLRGGDSSKEDNLTSGVSTDVKRFEVRVADRKDLAPVVREMAKPGLYVRMPEMFDIK